MPKFLLLLAALLVPARLFNYLWHRASGIRQDVLKYVERFIPLSMLPIEHTLLALCLVALTVLITAFPFWEPWASVLQQAAEPASDSWKFLGFGAALLALLTFAATQSRNLEKDHGSGQSYLGENVNTFLARRSRVLRMLSLPVFHVAVAALFVAPLVWMSLPSNFEVPTVEETLPPGEWSFQLVLIAFWCSSFAVVAVVLLLNVLGTLSNSGLGFRAPTWILKRIRFELGSNADQTYRELMKGTDGFPDDLYLWITTSVEKAAKLPNEQQRVYLQKTIGSFMYGIAQGKTMQKLDRTLSKLKPTSDAHTLDSKLHLWLQNYRIKRAKKLLQKRSNLAYKRTRAMLASLVNKNLNDEARNWLIKQCIIEVSTYDNDASQFLNGELPSFAKRDQTCQGQFYEEARDILTRPAQEIAALNSATHLHSRHQESPRVELLPIFTIKTLAAVLLPRGASENSKISLEMLQGTITIADGLQHEPTRNLALRHIVQAVIDCTIVNRSDSETLPDNVLKTRNRMRGETHHLEHEQRKSRELIIGQQAMRTLTSNPDLHPETRAVLLKLLEGWYLPTVLLHLLFYQGQSRKSLHTRDLEPFYHVLENFRWTRTNIPDKDLKNILDFFEQSNLNHFVTGEDVKWLFCTLDQPLTLELCVNFLKKNISSLSLLQFVQWRALTSGKYSYGASYEETCDENIRRQLLAAKPEIQMFATSWRAVDHRAAVNLETILLSFPNK